MRRWVVAAAVVASACGGGGGGATSLSAFCASLNAALAGAAVKCLHASATYLAAEHQESLGPDCGDLQKAANAGRLTFNSASAKACLDAVSSCAVFDPQRAVPAPCLVALGGTVGVGGTCFQDTDCQAGSFCDTATACPGACVAYAALGGDCTSSPCDPSLACDNGTGKCVAQAAAGAACANADPQCQAGLYCDPSGSTPICAAQKTSGACSTGLDQCATGYACTGTGSSTCQSLIGLGGDCSTAPELCGLGFECGADGKCASLPTIPNACSVGQLCVGGYCDSTGHCAAWKKKGDPCSTDQAAQCVTGICDGSRCVSDTCSPP